MVPAGFWRRCAAWSLDAALLAVPVAVLAGPGVASRWLALAPAFDAAIAPLATAMAEALGAGQPAAAVAGSLLSDPARLAAIAPLQAAATALVWPPVACFVLLSLLLHVGFEAGGRHATPGQRALGLRVVDADGRALGIVVALWRFVAGAASWLTLNVGHAMAALPPTHRALHDRISGTQVLFDGTAAERPLPGWAKAWLWLQAALWCGATAWAVTALEARMLAAVERALG